MLTLREIQRVPEKHAGPVTIGGWAKTIRTGKSVGFIELNDGTCFKSVQVVFPNDERNMGKDLSTGCSVRVTGQLVLTPDAPQPFEIQADSITLEGACPPDFPMQKKRHTLEYLRTQQTLRPRTNTFLAVFRVRSVVSAAIHEFFQQRGFVYVHTPILTNADCEGRGEMFQVTTLDLENVPKDDAGKVDYSKDFFRKPVHLAGTGQMYGEAFALAFRDIYTFGPTFRAEYSFTPRHAAEFWMIEPEMAFCDLKGDMEVAEAMVKYIIRAVLERCPQEMEFFNKFIDKGLLERLDNVVSNEFGRVSYTEAVDILQKSGEKFEFPVEWGIDLQSEHERYLTEKVFKKPIFVTDYPVAIKAFYMRLNDVGKTVAAAELLVPGVGEIIGGSQREDRYDVLKARCDQLGMDMSEYQWYLDLRRYGGVEHAGFGLGLDRIVMYLTGMSNIRDVAPFPRTTANLEM